MFGFGNSKQKNYKRALEEFLQKMMPVQDYFEIIQARGKGHAQMAEMLGVKVSDTDYWAKEHFEEYKSRLSESNDPLTEIELRLKNYSFIKKEMEGFINYAKELEMNLTQGFVDDYYAVVSTIKSLDKAKVELIKSSVYDEYGFRFEGEKDSNGNKIGLWKTYKTTDHGVSEYLSYEAEWVENPRSRGRTTMINHQGTNEIWYYENGNIKRNIIAPVNNSKEYVDAIKKSGFSQEFYLDTQYFENGNIFFEKITLIDDPNSWFESTYSESEKTVSKGHVINGLKSGKWETSDGEKYYFPLICNIISQDSNKENQLNSTEKYDQIAYSLSDDLKTIAPQINKKVVEWSSIDFEATNRGYPFAEGLYIIDVKNAFTTDDLKSDLVLELAAKQSSYKAVIDSRSNILEISAEQTKSYHYQIEFTSGGESKFEDETKLSTSRFELLEYVDGDVFESIDEFYIGLDNKIIDIKNLSKIHGYYDYDIGDGNRVEGEFSNSKEAIEGFNMIKTRYMDGLVPF